jgi:Holliday junction resolvasome RuvABC ATP-dependent DNA helicase subunit
MNNQTNKFIPSLDSMAHYIPRTICGINEVAIGDFARKEQFNILTFGHAGTGKTSFAQYLASLWKVPYVNVPSNDSLSASEVQGNMHFDPETSKWVWIDSPIVEVIRNGGVLNIGEIDKLAKNVKHFFLTLLDHRRSITLTAHLGEEIVASKDLLIIADFNPNYRGSVALPEQLADRFQIKLHYDYDRSLESQYIKSSALLDLAFGMRSTSVGQYESSDRSTVFETPITGRILKTFEKVAKDLSYDLACEIFANNFTPEERPAVKMLLEGASYNIKEDLGVAGESITTELDND